MPRQVSVKLDLDAAKYLAEAKAVEAETKSVDDKMKALGREADATGRDMDQLATQAAVAKREVNDLGDKARGATTDLRLLDGKLIATKMEVKRLGDEFARTGDEGIGKQLEAQKAMVVSLTKQRAEIVATTEKAKAFEQKAMQTATALKALDARILATKTLIHDLGIEFANTGDKSAGKELGSQRSLLGRLSKLRTELVADAAKAGQAAGTELMGSLNASFKGAASTPVLGPILIAAASVAALAAAPAIGAMISGAVIGAVGLGGIAGGIVAATSDPGVKAAWNDFTGSLTADGFGKQAFIKPVKSAIAELQAGLKDLKLGDALSKGAVAVPILAAGVAAFAKNVMPGFNAVMGRSEDIANAVSDGLGNVGTSLSSLLTDIVNSKGTMDGLRSIFTVLAGAITGTGNVLGFLGDAYHQLLQENEAVARANAHLYAGVPILGDAWGSLNTRLREMLGVGPEVEKTISGMGTAATAAGDGLDKTTRAAKKYEDSALRAALRTGDLSTAWDVLHGKTLSADESLLAAKKAVDDVSIAFQSGGKSIQGNTLAALENRLALEHAAQKASDAAKAYYDAHVAIDGQTSATAGANKIMEDQRVAAEKAAGATGKNKDAVHKLADELFKLPPYVPVSIDVKIQYRVTGAQLSKVDAQLARFGGGLASGGPVTAGKTYLVGENGPEIFTAETSGHIIPNGGGWQSASGGSGWQTASMGGGGGATQVALTISAAPGSDARVMAAITESLRFDVRTVSGGSAQVHFAPRGRN